MRRAARATEGAAFGLAVSIGDESRRVAQSERRVAFGTVDDVSKAVARVKEMSDAEAYMRLVTDNAQGELSPLEIGIHALGSVELSEGGAGKKGGLREYARQIGKDDRTIRDLKSAANVFKTAGLTPQFSDKATHLYEVSRAPETTWPLLCDALQAGALTTVDDVNKAVARVKPMSALHFLWNRNHFPQKMKRPQTRLSGD